MKRIIFVLSLLAGTIALGWSAISVDTTTWLDDEALITTNTNAYSSTQMDANNNLYKGGAFYIGRAYVAISGDMAPDIFSNSLKGNLTMDLANVNAAGSAVGLLKAAYFDYIFDKAFVFSGGLMKNYFGTMPNWSYPIPVKDPVELYSSIINSSADFGIMVSGKMMPIEGYTKNLISYNLQILNGEGYKTIYNNGYTPLQDTYAYLVNVGITPIDGLTAGFSYKSESLTATTNQSASFAVYATAKDVMGVPLDVTVEYAQNDYTNTGTGTALSGTTGESTLMSFTAGYGLFDKVVTPYVRYDLYTANTNTSLSNQTSVFFVGAAVKPSSQLVIKPLVGFYQQNGTATVGKIKNFALYNDMYYKLELEYKMNFKI